MNKPPAKKPPGKKEGAVKPRTGERSRGSDSNHQRRLSGSTKKPTAACATATDDEAALAVGVDRLLAGEEDKAVWPKQFKKPGQKPRGHLTCDRCGYRGHFGIDCTFAKDKKCGLCNKVGHLDRCCKVKSANRQPSVSDAGSRTGSFSEGGGRPVKKYAKLRPLQPESGPEIEAGKLTLGRSIELIANHYPIKVKAVTVYQYDVDIKPIGWGDETETTAEGGDASVEHFCNFSQADNRKVFDCLRSQKNGSEFLKEPAVVVYDDQKIIIANEKLKSDSLAETITVQLDPLEEWDNPKLSAARPIKCQVTLKFARDIQLKSSEDDQWSREALQALDIIFRHGPAGRLVAINGRFGWSFYPKQTLEENGKLKPHKEMLFGHHQAVHQTEAGLALVVDQAVVEFCRPPLFEGKHFTLLGFIQELIGPLADFDINQKWKWYKMSNKLKELRVYSLHLNYKRSYIIHGLSEETPDKLMSEDQTSVRNYIKSHYKDHLTGGKLHYPNLPYVVVTSTGKDKSYLPPELLFLHPNQPAPKFDDSDKSLVQEYVGKINPEERFGEIQLAIEEVASDNRANLETLGIELIPRPLQVTGRVIDKPVIQGIDEKGSGKFKIGKELKNWAYINLSKWIKDEQDIKNFIKKLRDEAKKRGMTIGQPRALPSKFHVRFDDLKGIFEKVKDVELLLCFTDPESPIREMIKYYADVEFGITCQLVKANIVKEPIQNKMLMKINAKLGGVSRIVEGLTFHPTDEPKTTTIDIFIGADLNVTRSDKAVAAVVGSYTQDYSCFYSTVRLQKNSEKGKTIKIIEKFDEMFEELLENYKQKNGRYPVRIVYYRDGLFESQFKAVIANELKKIKSVYAKLNQEQTPKITFVTVVQKYYQTRLRTVDKLVDKYGKIKDVEPGTAIDRHVIEKTDYDCFLLVNPENPLGTSRPTHYYVLHDDNRFSPDDLTRLTYQLCFLNSRHETPAAIPLPVYYAHLAAVRARDHIAAKRKKESNKRIDDKMVQVKRKDSMYFC